MPRVTGRVGTVNGRMLTVVEHAYHVSIHDHPDPKAHAGWSLHIADARALAEALIKATSDGR